MTKPFTERQAVQKPFIEYARKDGWIEIDPGKALSYRKGKEGKIFSQVLAKHLISFNQDFIGDEEANEIIRKLENIPDSIEGNQKILEWIRGERSFYDQKEERHRNVKIIDFDHPENNSFFITEEWLQSGGCGKDNRLDLVFLVNGIPLAIVENKNPKKVGAMEEAINQLKRYESETPEMLSCPQVFNITHLVEYFYGVTWNYSRKNIFNWKYELGAQRDKNISLKNAVKTFFNKKYFLTMIKDWVIFFSKDNELQKTILKQHQTRAIGKILARCSDNNKSRGLIWHTQGAGKTFTIITAARMILESHQNATVMLVVDRNELEGQLAGWVDSLLEKFKPNRDINVKKAESKDELRSILSYDFRGLIVTMIHKFDKIESNINTKENFYVLIDEAHRSVNRDLGTYLMAVVPNATIFGFTGTPIDKIAQGKGTFKIFGVDDKQGYLDKYSIKESIEDGTTLKLRHTAVDNEMMLPGDLLEKEFLEQAEAEGISDIDDLNNVLQRAVKLRTFLKAKDRIKKTSKYISKHFKENVQPLGYKAFVVAVDREACALYKEELDKYFAPEESCVVYTGGHNDPEMLSRYIMPKEKEAEVRKIFKKPGRNPQIFIVTDKLLTGYDAPILYCMYLDKPMRDHILLQAIARVNRPYENERGIQKPCGVIIDFVGIFKSMHKALSFDSDEVDAVIEDLDMLFNVFNNRICQHIRAIQLEGEQIDNIERIIYEDFSDTEKRKKFIQEVKEIESMYDILSPDKKLHPLLKNYQKLIEVKQLLQNAYAEKTSFLGALSKKTENLIKNNAKIIKISSGETFEINAESLSKIKKDESTSDSIKIMNLIKAIVKISEDDKTKNPTLISISEKAKDTLKRFKENQDLSKEILQVLMQLAQDIINAKKEQVASGLDSNTFLIYWEIKGKNIKNAKNLAMDIERCFGKFEHFKSNSEEMRQLKVELYKLLIPNTSETEMVAMVEKLIHLRRFYEKAKKRSSAEKAECVLHSAGCFGLASCSARKPCFRIKQPAN